MGWGRGVEEGGRAPTRWNRVGSCAGTTRRLCAGDEKNEQFISTQRARISVRQRSGPPAVFGGTRSDQVYEDLEILIRHHRHDAAKVAHPYAGCYGPALFYRTSERNGGGSTAPPLLAAVFSAWVARATIAEKRPGPQRPGPYVPKLMRNLELSQNLLF